MNWRPALFSLIVILLYIPTVFMGANVFFPRYDQYPEPDCSPSRVAVGGLSAAEQAQMDRCWDEYDAQRKVFESEKRVYDGWKYFFIVVLNLVALLAALVVPLQSSILYGLFVGSTLATFFSTWIYFGTRSRPGFVVLVIIFVASVYFINRQREAKSVRKR